MPVYTEKATLQRELRVQPNVAHPLPDLAADRPAVWGPHEYDVIVVGAGPCGLLATLLLSRYGLSDARLLCIDSKPGTLRSGQADGLQPRTMEVIESLGLHHEIVDQACHFWEISFWGPKEGGGGIRRNSYAGDVQVPSQYPHESTIHQGRIERIFDDNLKLYSSGGVERSTRLISLQIDDQNDQKFPVLIEVEKEENELPKQRLASGKHQLRCKYLVGADGAHSLVRRAVDIPLVGESREHIWGVMDFVAETKFPDIRRKSMAQSVNSSCMVIPRERIATGEYLTRLYVHMDEVELDSKKNGVKSIEEAKEIARQKRGHVSLEKIFEKANQVLEPYKVSMKAGTQPDWWAAYEIAQRMCENFIKRDSTGTSRVFLAGDACHTHSPKAGQGMNVSMMDGYNLAWKLAHVILEICPESRRQELLESYETERRKVARELIEYDAALSTAFSSKLNNEKISANDFDSHKLDEIWRIGHEFTSGCGIEYQESALVKQDVGLTVKGDSYLNGILRPGRRILNTRVQRHADGAPVELHRELPSEGCFNILVLASTDILELAGRSARAISFLSTLLTRYTPGVLRPIILHALSRDIRGIEWDMLPSGIHEHAEMSFHSANPGQHPEGKDADTWGVQRDAQDVYKIYGVSKSKGALVVIRPDQVIGIVADLEEESTTQEYLDRWLTPRG